VDGSEVPIGLNRSRGSALRTARAIINSRSEWKRPVLR
jgi:hypothetical protein